MTPADGTWRAALLDALHDALFVLDGTGSVVHVNAEFGALLGYGPEGLPYRRPFPWWPDPDSDAEGFAEVRAIDDRIARGEPGRWHVRLRHRDGHRIWAECSTAAVGEGADRQVVGIARDITDQQRAIARDRLLAQTGRLLIQRGELDSRLDALATAIADHFDALVTIERTGPDGSLETVATAGPVSGGRTGERAHDPDGSARTLIAPMVLSERVVGRLSVVGPPEGDRFDESDRSLAEEMAVRIAGVLQADAVATRERQLHDATAALAAAVTAEDAAAALAGALRDALGPFGVVVYTAIPDDPTRLRLAHNLGYPEEFEAGFNVIRIDQHRLTADLLRTGRPFWLPTRRSWEEHYPYIGGIQGLRVAKAGAVLPLRLGERIVGVVAAAFETEREFTEDERTFALTLAGQAAQAFERAELSDTQWRIARRLQEHLLARELPIVDGVALAAHYQPAGEHLQAGGDWYQAIDLGEGKLAVVVGDVVGHGLAASTVMARLRIALAAYLVEGHGPAEALRLLSAAATRLTGALASTAVCTVLDVRTGELCWASAGHPPPLLVDPNNAVDPVRYLSGARGGVLGAGHSGGFAVAHTESRVVLAPGASVLLYSDGLVERSQENLGAGLNRLAAAVKARPDAGPDEMLEAALSGALRDTTPDDDVAVVIVRLLPRPAQGRPPADVGPGSAPSATLIGAPEERPLYESALLKDMSARWDPDGALTLELAGALDLSTADIVRAEVMRYLDASTGRVVIDTAGLTYLGSAGIRLLAEAVQKSSDRVRLRVERGSAAATSLAVSGFELDAIDLRER